MQVFVDEVAARHPERLIVMALDGAGRHRGQGLKLPANLRLLFLPPYAPEPNRSSMSGTNCARSYSTTSSSTVWRRWRTNSTAGFATSKAICPGCAPSFLGPG
jgi:transposase